MMATLRLICALGAAFIAFSAQAGEAGQGLFEKQCVACHQAGGKGMTGLAPALAGPFAKSIESADGRLYISQVLINGMSGRIVSQGQTFMGAMASQAAMSDADLAELGNYLAQGLNGAATAPFVPEDFAKARTQKMTHKDLRELREKLPK